MSRLLVVAGVLGAALAMLGTALLATGARGPLPEQPTAAPSLAAAPASVVHETSADTNPEQRSNDTTTSPAQASGAWVRRTAARTGIAVPALQAYANTSLRMAVEKPTCRLGWTTLAGIGQIETGHGQGVLDANGRASRTIQGPALDGTSGNASIEVQGSYDRARGPMQFIASTWQLWAADGDGDGERSVDDVDDAALAAGRYLCHDGRDLTTPSGWSAAIFSYNHSDEYVKSVLAAANGYAARA